TGVRDRIGGGLGSGHERAAAGILFGHFVCFLQALKKPRSLFGLRLMASLEARGMCAVSWSGPSRIDPLHVVGSGHFFLLNPVIIITVVFRPHAAARELARTPSRFDVPPGFDGRRGQEASPAEPLDGKGCPQ